MEIEKNKRIIIIITILGIIGLISWLVLSFVFIKTTVSPVPSDSLITIDGGKGNTGTTTKYLLVGNHTIKGTKSGYGDGIKNISVSYGHNNFTITLTSLKQKFIDALPYNTDKWSAYYSADIDSITVIINSEPYEENKAEATNWLKSLGVDLNRDIVIFGAVAGVGPETTGP